MIPTHPSEGHESLFRLFTLCMTDRCFRFTGRARRREFWGFALFALIADILLAALLLLALRSETFCTDRYIADDLIGGLPDLPSALTTAGIVLCVILSLLALWLLIAGIAVTVRRFHDSNLPAWPAWLGIFLTILPAPLFYTPEDTIGGPGAFVLMTLLAACAVIFILGVAIVPGGKKKNKYGPAPKGEQ